MDLAMKLLLVGGAVAAGTAGYFLYKKHQDTQTCASSGGSLVGGSVFSAGTCQPAVNANGIVVDPGFTAGGPTMSLSPGGPTLSVTPSGAGGPLLSLSPAPSTPLSVSSSSGAPAGLLSMLNAAAKVAAHPSGMVAIPRRPGADVVAGLNRTLQMITQAG